jgi:phosphoglycolate phosphatase
MIRNVIFDLDGTLVDSAPVCADILSEMLHDRGSTRRISVADATPFLSRGGKHMISGLLGADCADPELEIADFRTRYLHHPTPPESLYPGVFEGLGQLAAAGLTLGICSNKPQKLCQKVLSDLGLVRHFSTILGGAPGRLSKPNPQLLEMTLEELGALPEHCLFVGDSEIDHAAAEAVGIAFLLVNYGYSDERWDRLGLIQFSNFPDVVKLILEVHQSRRTWRRAA